MAFNQAADGIRNSLLKVAERAEALTTLAEELNAISANPEQNVEDTYERVHAVSPGRCPPTSLP